jgi:hypothetical protein
LEVLEIGENDITFIGLRYLVAWLQTNASLKVIVLW